MPLSKADVIEIVRLALKEDIGDGDITTSAIFVGTEPATAKIVAKMNGIFCSGGLPSHIYGEIDSLVKVRQLIDDGSPIESGDVACEITGPAASILIGERTVLNFLQRMCGIATATARAVKALEGSDIQILDTRKTAPGLRVIDKYAVKMGGGKNHRYGLYDMILIKDNHIKAAGGILAAVEAVRRVHGSRFPIEVEAKNEEEVRQALEAGVDIIMLDNMQVADIENCLAIIGKRVKVELSGNITIERLSEFKKLPVTYISMGQLTHSVQAFDLSMKFE
ncbi:MAG: carboxylating nicotinate-nucleotide diphosphorylase [Spirochaetes bacterium]|nr:carboxylating nicotinate-nucleotide diphosphorylase [Spirochaetota bacterium]